ncbi:MAG: acyl-CoA thioesterase [Bacteroidales bacterium]|nr:acyl-CoA thioesterase [Bacteroidales bacterium]
MLPVTSKTKYRVLYADTDQMGVVYYGNYARFFEIGRTEMIREMGMPYMELEESGIMMPVYSVESKYRDVIRYDELITIETKVRELPSVRMEFFHRIFNEAGKLVHEAKVVLVFLNMETRRPVRAPERLLRLMGG